MNQPPSDEQRRQWELRKLAIKRRPELKAAQEEATQNLAMGIVEAIPSLVALVSLVITAYFFLFGTFLQTLLFAMVTGFALGFVPIAWLLRGAAVTERKQKREAKALLKSLGQKERE